MKIATPRTDAMVGEVGFLGKVTEFARQLERELSQANATILNQRAFLQETESYHQGIINELAACKEQAKIKPK